MVKSREKAANIKRVDITKLMEYLPHRYPFVMIDRIIDYEEGKWIKAIKNVTINEPYFQGHFPGEPIVPGVLQVESLVQTGGFLILLEEGAKDKIAYFMTIDNAKFRKPVIPGDQLVLDVSLVKRIRSNILQVHGEGSVDGKLVCQADMMFSVMDRGQMKY